MGHYSEMDFLFSSIPNRDSIVQQLNANSDDNRRNIFRPQRYIVHKNKPVKDLSGNTISYNTNTAKNKDYLKDNVYRDSDSNLNPYVRILKDKTFNQKNGLEGAGLRIKAADLAYLKELGVYPMNRMVILRRFRDGSFVPENLEEMKFEPISTVVGWLPPDKSFGNISFNESWTVTTKRLDVLIADILQKATGIPLSVIPVPDFAQGLLFGFYQRMGLSGSMEDDDDYINSDWTTTTEADAKIGHAQSTYGMSNIPVGDPNVLKEGPFRDPETQNIQSEFNFDFDTTYEQKLIGDVDPGSAMLDIIDNLMTMGTSNMSFYWNENSGVIKTLKNAAKDNANSLTQWWDFVKEFMTTFWKALTSIFGEIIGKLETIVSTAQSKADEAAKTADEKAKADEAANANMSEAEKLKSKLKGQLSVAGAAANSLMIGLKDMLLPVLQSMLASTVSIHRFQIRGSIELMTGSRDSSTPWYLTIGNPYSPWLATNHIIVKNVTIDTSPEMGFNDQPQWLKATFQCKLSRALGRQELLRMFNNTYTRTYTDPKKFGDYNYGDFWDTSVQNQMGMTNLKPVIPGYASDADSSDVSYYNSPDLAPVTPKEATFEDSPPTPVTRSGGNPPGFVDAYSDWMGSQ